jgi:hypothetical protein
MDRQRAGYLQREREYRQMNGKTNRQKDGQTEDIKANDG